MFRNIKAIYGYGFGGYGMGKEALRKAHVLSAVRGSTFIDELPVLHSEEFHTDGVMLVYKEAASEFYCLYGKQLHPTPRNVIHYPGRPQTEYSPDNEFGAFFQRWQYSPFESFAKDLQELDELMGTSEYQRVARKWQRQLPGIARREERRRQRLEYLRKLRWDVQDIGDAVVYHSRKQGDIQATLARQWSYQYHRYIWIRQTAAPHLVYRVNPVLVGVVTKDKTL